MLMLFRSPSGTWCGLSSLFHRKSAILMDYSVERLTLLTLSFALRQRSMPTFIRRHFMSREQFPTVLGFTDVVVREASLNTISSASRRGFGPTPTSP